MDRIYYKLYPNMYIIIVGPTGITKTTAADIGIDILEQIPDIEMYKEKINSWTLLKHFGDLSVAFGHSMCTLYAPELKNFLSDLNKTDMVTLLTSFYGCPNTPNYHTIKHGNYQLKNVCVNLLGCSTPEWLTTGTTVDEIHGGFTGRIVYVYEDETDRSIPFPEDFHNHPIKQFRADLLHDLEEIRKLKGKMTITPQAKAEYIVWYEQRKLECRDERLAAYFSRKRDLVFKLAMILSAAKDDSLVIDESTLRMSWQMLEQVEEKMAKAFSGVVEEPSLKYRDLVVSQITSSPGHSITKAELLRKNWNRFDAKTLATIIDNLSAANIIKTPIQKTQDGRLIETYSLR
uniref:Putative primase n=1 Tax=viral metagenome TaxID=1070528 RepID=A0A6M3IJ38_9ZZZZ